jgi:hypothetical protein
MLMMEKGWQRGRGKRKEKQGKGGGRRKWRKEEGV